MFSDAEVRYLTAGGLERLARLATVDAAGTPTVDAVGYTYADGLFTIGTHHGDITATRKGRNVRDGRTGVSLIVDDVESVDPWRPRGVKVHGVAEVRDLTGHFGPGTYLVVRPLLTWSWGLEGSVFESGARRVDWQQQETSTVVNHK